MRTNPIEAEALEGEALEDVALEDKALEDEALGDEALEDEALEDEALETRPLKMEHLLHNCSNSPRPGVLATLGGTRHARGYSGLGGTHAMPWWLSHHVFHVGAVGPLSWPDRARGGAWRGGAVLCEKKT